MLEVEIEINGKRFKGWYNEESDSLYVRLYPGQAIRSEEIEKGLVVYYDVYGDPIAVEVLNFSKNGYKLSSVLTRLNEVP